MALRVTGVAPSAYTQPTELALGTVYVGSSVERTVQLVNTGTVPLFVKNASFGASVAGMTLTHTCSEGVLPGALVRPWCA